MASVLTIHDAPGDREGTALVRLRVAGGLHQEGAAISHCRYVEISAGGKSVVGLVEAIHRGQGEIFVDPMLRDALGIAEGSEVTIEPVKPMAAKEVSVRVRTENLAAADLTQLCRTYLTRQPLAAGQVKPVFSFSGQRIELEIVEVQPQDFCIFESTTQLRVSEVSEEHQDQTDNFANLGGLDREITFLRERVIGAFTSREIYRQLGLPLPHGLLLSGPPGTGKTLLAQALAKELRMSCRLVRGPELLSATEGGTEKAIREVFGKARDHAPAALIFDEIDSLVSNRSAVPREGERRTVAAILTEMDRLGPDELVLIIGTTHLPDALDAALRRPGRFDLELTLRVPDKAGRLDLLKVHTRSIPLARTLDLSLIAARAPGFAGADVMNLCREAALRAAQRGAAAHDPIRASIAVQPEDFDAALKTVRASALRGRVIDAPASSWDEIGGLDQVKTQLKEIVKTLIEPDVFARFGIRAPRGALLHGRPGTGKTALARLVATQCEANFIPVTAATLLSKWFSESEANVRATFRRARELAPCVLFFDEIEGIAGARGDMGNESADRVVSEILIEMDGLEGGQGVMVIGATNRLDLIDEALLRPGRFDYQIEVPLPDAPGREAIFRIHLRDKPLAPDVNAGELAARTDDFSGAEISEVCRRAALDALREKDLDPVHALVSQQHLTDAIDERWRVRHTHRPIGFTVN